MRQIWESKSCKEFANRKLYTSRKKFSHKSYSCSEIYKENFIPIFSMKPFEFGGYSQILNENHEIYFIFQRLMDVFHFKIDLFHGFSV